MTRAQLTFLLLFSAASLGLAALMVARAAEAVTH